MGINDRVRSFQIALVSGRSHISIWTAERWWPHSRSEFCSLIDHTEAVPGVSVPRRRTPVVIVVIGAIGAIGAVLYYLFTVIS